MRIMPNVVGGVRHIEIGGELIPQRFADVFLGADTPDIQPDSYFSVRSVARSIALDDDPARLMTTLAGEVGALITSLRHDKGPRSILHVLALGGEQSISSLVAATGRERDNLSGALDILVAASIIDEQAASDGVLRYDVAN